MSSHVRHMRKSRSGEKTRSSLELEFDEERLGRVLDASSLRDVPLAERRREAQRPLYLVRYE